MFDYLPEVRRGEPITAAMWNTMVRAIRKRTPQAGFGLTSTIGDGGITFSVIPMSEIFGELHPWYVSKTSPTQVKVYPATVSGGGTNITPTIGGTAIDQDPAPELTISGLSSGTKYVRAKFEFTPTFDADGTLEEWTLDSVSIISETSPTADDTANGDYYRTIATFVDGVKTAQMMNYSLDVVLLNKGSFASEAWMVAMASG